MGTEAIRTVLKQGTGSLSGNANATLLEWKDTTNRLHGPPGLCGYFAAAGTYSVAVRFWNGTSYTTYKVVDGALTTTAKGGTTSRLYIAEFNIVPPPFGEVVITDTSGSTNAYEFSLAGISV